MEEMQKKPNDYLLELLALSKIMLYNTINQESEEEIKKYMKIAIDGYNRTTYILKQRAKRK